MRPEGLEAAFERQVVRSGDVLKVPDRSPVTAALDVRTEFPDVSRVDSPVGRVAVLTLEADVAVEWHAGHQVAGDRLFTGQFGMFIVGLIFLPLSVIYVRILCEMMIVIFRISDNLAAIRAMKEKERDL